MTKLLAILLLSASACVPVEAWQRGVLADRQMQWARDPERASARTHVFSIREGASGGAGGGGGACGCD
jgi:hypothetical protein